MTHLGIAGILVLLLGLVSGCGDDDDSSGRARDAGSDTSDGDAASDAGIDADGDASDAELDASPDATADADAEVDAPSTGCVQCHGNAANAAPPADTKGLTGTENAGVGAHQSHLAPSTTFRSVACGDCHEVPSDGVGHVDSLPAELAWSPLAKADGVTPKYENGKCSAYCHGKSLAGGSLTEPSWTTVDGSQAACGNCHGLPPPAPHPKLVGAGCAPCHDFKGAVPNDPTKHVDGKVDVVNVCEGCHGSSQSYAPPKDVQGNTNTSAPGVGAHQAHLGTQAFRTVQCGDCHVVPATLGAPGHLGDPPAELSWGSIASADGVTAAYSSGKCSVYCHGKSLGGGSLVEPTWTSVATGQAACGTCHGLPPPAPHPKLTKQSCSPCHTDFTGLVATSPSQHADGKVDVAKCGECHAVPPATGAHLRHYGDSASPPLSAYGDLGAVAQFFPAGAGYYMFGCGNCHPLDDEKHGNGQIEIELANPQAAPGSLKALSPVSATYGAGKCSNVYCHSSGQATPSYVVTPSWNGGTLGAPRCAACHGNPPKYPSGGAGSATANTHVVMADDGYELGHFGGLPGPWHTSYHGGTTDQAAPITCQTCHYQTVDPANVGPGGFYYLDTTSSFDLGGQLGYTCTSCHTSASGAPAVKAGEVRPLLHVDGKRQVTFDPRTSIPPSVTGLPTGANRPSRPYWVSAIPSPAPPYSSVDGSTWSLSLEAASYDPAQKTCANVACHLRQSFGSGKPQYEPLRWGTLPVGYASCSSCHQF
ncbi:MAG: CxxxxCH/CxxCH domain-containing protein [Polyangiaceae bacterium]